MTTKIKRLLKFCIVIPLELFLAFIPFYNHLPLNIVILFFVAFSADEFYNILSKQAVLPPKVLMIIVSLLMPVATYLFSLFGINQDIVIWILLPLILVIIILLYQIFDSTIICLA